MGTFQKMLDDRAKFNDLMARAMKGIEMNERLRVIGQEREPTKRIAAMHLAECLEIAKRQPLHSDEMVWVKRIKLAADRARITLDLLEYPPSADVWAAYEVGKGAFRGVSARIADAMRGTKSWPDTPRCPYRMPIKVKAWNAGYDREHDAFMDAWRDEMEDAA